jgi:hypothetical protein
MEIYRYIVMGLTIIAALLFGIGIHTVAQGNVDFGFAGIVLGMIAQGMAIPLRNPPFNCLLVVIALVIIVVAAIL